MVFNKMKKNKKVTAYNLNSQFNNVVDTDEITKFINFLMKKKITIRDTFNFASSRPIKIKDIFKIA